MTNEFFMYLYGTLFKTIKYRISGLDIHMCTFHKPISITIDFTTRPFIRHLYTQSRA